LMGVMSHDILNGIVAALKDFSTIK
jgi:hypothetical protein